MTDSDIGGINKTTIRENLGPTLGWFNVLPAQSTFYPSGNTGTDIQRALDAAGAYVAGGANGASVLLDGIPYSNVQIQVPKDNIAVIGQAGTVLKPVAGSADVNMISFSQDLAVSAVTALSSNAAQFESVITVASTAGASVGRLMGFSWTQPDQPTTNFFFWTFRILAVVGSTIRFTPALPKAVVTSDTHQIFFITPRIGNILENLEFDCAGNSGHTFGIQGVWQSRGIYRNLRFKNFSAAGAVVVDQGYNNTVDNMYAFRSGSSGNASIEFRAQTLGQQHNIMVDDSTGFAINCVFGTYLNQGTNWRVAHSSSIDGRGIKWAATTFSSFDNMHVSSTSSTGLALTWGTQDNNFSNLVSVGNGVNNPSPTTNEIGVWFSGNDNSRNVLTNVIAIGNAVNDIGLAATDNDNIINGGNWNTVSDTGANNHISKHI